MKTGVTAFLLSLSALFAIAWVVEQPHTRWTLPSIVALGFVLVLGGLVALGELVYEK